jgi:hypothetical protein
LKDNKLFITFAKPNKKSMKYQISRNFKITMALALIAGYLFTTMLCYYLFRSNDFDFFAVFWFLGTIAIYIAYYYRMTIKIEGNLLTYKTTNEVKTRTLSLSEIATVSIRKKLFYPVLTITTKQQTKIHLYPEQPERLEKALIVQ